MIYFQDQRLSLYKDCRRTCNNKLEFYKIIIIYSIINPDVTETFFLQISLNFYLMKY